MFFRRIAPLNSICAVDARGDGVHFFAEAGRIGVAKLQVLGGFGLRAEFDHGVRQIFAACTAFFPHSAHDDLHAERGACLLQQLHLGIRITGEMVDGNDDRKFEYLRQIFNVFEQIGQTALQCVQIFLG